VQTCAVYLPARRLYHLYDCTVNKSSFIRSKNTNKLTLISWCSARSGSIYRHCWRNSTILRGLLRLTLLRYICPAGPTGCH